MKRLTLAALGISFLVGALACLQIRPSETQDGTREDLAAADTGIATAAATDHGSIVGGRIEMLPITHAIREPSELEAGGYQGEIRGKLKDIDLRWEEPISPQLLTKIRAQKAQIDALRRELYDLRTELGSRQSQIHNMRTELLVAGAPTTPGPIADWISNAPADAKPSPKQIRFVADMHANFPVRMTEAEAAWIAERADKGDWKLYGPSADEAVLEYLGRARIMAEVSEADLARLRAEYAEEGYFSE